MVKIILLDKNKISKNKILFEDEKSSFLLSRKDINKKSKLRHALSEVAKDDIFFLAKKDTKTLAYASLKKLNWDTKHFGLKMGSLRIRSLERNYRKKKGVASFLINYVLEKADKQRFNHLSAKMNFSQIEEIQALEENGFYYTGCLVSYIVDLNDFNSYGSSKVTSVDIREFKPDDLKRLKEITYNSFKERDAWLDRFHADPYLNKKKSDELYVKWLINCCRGDKADLVFVAKEKGRLVGFISTKYDKDIKRHLKKKVARIPLNAVDKKYRRRGIYRELVYHLLSVLKAKAFDYAIITTQLNAKAVARVWMGAGARIESSKLVFHKKVG